MFIHPPVHLLCTSFQSTCSEGSRAGGWGVGGKAGLEQGARPTPGHSRRGQDRHLQTSAQSQGRAGPSHACQTLPGLKSSPTVEPVAHNTRLKVTQDQVASLDLVPRAPRGHWCCRGQRTLTVRQALSRPPAEMFLARWARQGTVSVGGGRCSRGGGDLGSGKVLRKIGVDYGGWLSPSWLLGGWPVPVPHPL